MFRTWCNKLPRQQNLMHTVSRLSFSWSPDWLLSLFGNDCTHGKNCFNFIRVVQVEIKLWAVHSLRMLRGWGASWQSYSATWAHSHDSQLMLPWSRQQLQMWTEQISWICNCTLFFTIIYSNRPTRIVKYTKGLYNIRCRIQLNKVYTYALPFLTLLPRGRNLEALSPRPRQIYNSYAVVFTLVLH